MSMWCTSRLKREVLFFKPYFFKKFIFAACLPTHFNLFHFRKYNAEAGSSRNVSPYCDLKADF
jgi:hypothetical protein